MLPTKKKIIIFNLFFFIKKKKKKKKKKSKWNPQAFPSPKINEMPLFLLATMDLWASLFRKE